MRDNILETLILIKLLDDFFDGFLCQNIPRIKTYDVSLQRNGSPPYKVIRIDEKKKIITMK